jgi:RNA polymerase sigma-70 factor, ECF subfamily
MSCDPAGLGARACFVGEEISGGTWHRNEFTANGESFASRCLRFQGGTRLSRCKLPDSGVRNSMSSSEAIVLAGEGRRRPSPFALGLRETETVAIAVKSAVAMPNAAAQPGARTKLTVEQMEARQQQRAEDDELIRAAQKGDRQAFDALVRRYDRSVLRLAMHVLGNEQDAQDVHQEAFLKAYRHLSNFRFECSFYTWLYRIVTNLCLDQLRRRKSRREDPSTALDGAGEEMDLLANLTDGRASANPARELERKTMSAAIQDALNELTPRERTVFELKHYQGLKLRTIGEMLSTTEETAKNTLFRATRKLRSRLADAR